jgi:hypothetical protein
MFPNLKQRSIDSTNFMGFSKPLNESELEVEERVFAGFEPQCKMTYFNLTNLKDENLNKAIVNAVADIAAHYPDFTCTTELSSSALYSGEPPDELSLFRIVAMYKKVECEVCLKVQLKYENGPISIMEWLRTQTLE